MKVYKYNSIPEVSEVAPGILKTVVPQPFYAPNNIYIINSKEDPAIIDSGFIQNLGLLQRALKKIGLSLHKVKHVIYTHNHIDHISAALVLKYYTKATVYGMKGMAQSVGDYITYLQSFLRAEKRLLYKAINDPNIRKTKFQKIEDGMSRFMKGYYDNKDKVNRFLPIDVELVEGDVINIGDKEIGFLHTPGHNNWHLTPYLLGEGIYFTGDLVLENISAIYAEVDGNLNDYHKSLERLIRLPIKKLLPAHGSEIENPIKSIKLVSKTLSMLEKGVTRRLKSKDYDLAELVALSMGEKVTNSPYYIVALGIIHSIVSKFIKNGDVIIKEVDPPYEKYSWVK